MPYLTDKQKQELVAILDRMSRRLDAIEYLLLIKFGTPELPKG